MSRRDKIEAIFLGTLLGFLIFDLMEQQKQQNRNSVKLSPNCPLKLIISFRLIIGVSWHSFRSTLPLWSRKSRENMGVRERMRSFMAFIEWR